MCWMVQDPPPLWLIKCKQCAYVPASDGPDHMTKSFNNSASVRGSYQGCVSYVWIASCKVHSGWFCTYKACFCSGRFASLAVHQFEIMCHKIRRVSLKWHSKLLHSGAEFAVQLNLQCNWASSRNLNKAPETKAKLQKLILGKVHACKCGLCTFRRSHMCFAKIFQFSEEASDLWREWKVFMMCAHVGSSLEGHPKTLLKLRWFLLVSFPNPTPSCGETVWWTKLNFFRTLLQQCHLATFKNVLSQTHQKKVRLLK